MAQPAQDIISIDRRRRAMAVDQFDAAMHDTVPCHKTLVHALKGDIKAAVFMRQVIYLQEQWGDDAGWFYMDADGWYDELCMSWYEVNRCCEVLAPFGLETMKRVVNGPPVKHFRVNMAKYRASILEFLENAPPTHKEQKRSHRNFDKVQIEETQSSKLKKLESANSTNFKNIPTEIPSEIPNESSDANASGSAASADMPSVDAPAPRKTKKASRRARVPKASDSEQDKNKDPPELIAFRAQCCGIIRARFNGGDPTNSELGAIRNLYNKRYAFEQVKDCWEILNSDTTSRYTQTFELMPMKMRDYTANPEAFRQKYAPQAQQNTTRQQGNTHAKPTQADITFDSQKYNWDAEIAALRKPIR